MLTLHDILAWGITVYGTTAGKVPGWGNPHQELHHYSGALFAVKKAGVSGWWLGGKMHNAKKLN